LRRSTFWQLIAAVGATPCQNTFHLGRLGQTIRLKPEFVSKTSRFLLDLLAWGRFAVCAIAS
jgi:hypothetical protein